MGLEDFWESRKGEQILLLLSDDKSALEVAKTLDDGSCLWLSESDLIRGHFPLEPKSMTIYLGTMDELISVFSTTGNLADNCAILKGLLKGSIAAFNTQSKDFEYYVCDVVVMPCCVGEYLKIVNRKEL